jgi:tetratricopeptide (TPR) repeat protein
MATRKKRLQEVAPVVNTKPKETARYQDAFQRASEKRIEDVSKSFAGKGRTLLYAIGAVVVLAILLGIFVSWNRRSNAQAQAALGKAIETAEAQVSDQPQPAGSTIKTFKTDKERAEAAIAEFQSVAEKYPTVKDKANYFIAVNRLSVDRAAGVAELENLSKTGGEVGTLSKFALAQAYAGDGKFDDAARLYQEIAGLNDSIVAKDTVNFALASVYEKQDKKADAANIYYDIAKRASEAKDADGKAIPMTQTARDAKEKLKALDPARAGEIKDPEPEIQRQTF